MHIILNIVPAGGLATTGLNIAMLALFLALIIAVGFISNNKLRSLSSAGGPKGAYEDPKNMFAEVGARSSKPSMEAVRPFAAAGVVIMLALANLAGGGAVSEVSALTSHSVSTPELVIDVEQGATVDAGNSVEITVNSDSETGWELLARAVNELPTGLGLTLGGVAITNSGARIAYDSAPTNGDLLQSFTVSASADENLTVGKYDIEVTFDTVDKAQDGGENEDLGEHISTNNVDFSNREVNMGGGDLIVRSGGNLTINSASLITIDNTLCTAVADTSASVKNVTSKDGTNRVGCVLPSKTLSNVKIADGVHSVKINGKKVGEIEYKTVEFNSADSTTAKAAMKQGEVRVLVDTRCSANNGDADCGDVAGLGTGKYRVKKMPKLASEPEAEQLLMMVDNLAYEPTVADFPNTNAEIINSTDELESVTTSPQVVTTSHTSNSNTMKAEYGYLYNYCAAVKDASSTCSDSKGSDTSVINGKFNGKQGILPENWILPTGNSVGQFVLLNVAMTAEGKGISNGGNANPVYSSTSSLNWGSPNLYGPSPDTNSYNDAPAVGVYAANYTGRLNDQGNCAYYWSSTAVGGNAYKLYFFPDYDMLSLGSIGTGKANAFAVRGVL